MSAEARLAELGITLPEAGKPLGTYIPVRIAGGMAHVSGQGPNRPDGNGAVIGKVPSERTVEEAVEAARFCGLQALAQLRKALGSLDRIEWRGAHPRHGERRSRLRRASPGHQRVSRI